MESLCCLHLNCRYDFDNFIIRLGYEVAGILGSGKVALEAKGDKATVVFYILLTILLAGLVTSSSFDAAIPEESHYPNFSSSYEKLSIQQVTFGTSPKLISIFVVGIQAQRDTDSIKITTAIIKNASGYIVQAIALTATIQANNSLSTVGVNLAYALASNEQYTVTLTTDKGSSFVSSPFTSP